MLQEDQQSCEARISGILLHIVQLHTVRVCVCVCIQTTASPSLRQCSRLVQNAWGNLKEAGLRAYLMTSGQPEEREVNLARLEASSSNLSKKLVDLFEQLFFTPKVRSPLSLSFTHTHTHTHTHTLSSPAKRVRHGSSQITSHPQLLRTEKGLWRVPGSQGHYEHTNAQISTTIYSLCLAKT